MMTFLAVYLGCAILNFAFLALAVFKGWTDSEGDSRVAATIVLLGPIGTIIWCVAYVFVPIEMAFRKLYARGRK